MCAYISAYIHMHNMAMPLLWKGTYSTFIVFTYIGNVSCQQYIEERLFLSVLDEGVGC